MQDAIHIGTGSKLTSELSSIQTRRRLFLASLIGCIVASAAFASWLPLPVSIVTVFLFAGPHNWFELRYFLMRLPVRFGKSRNFFLVAFTGLGILTISYVSLPLIYRANVWSPEAVSVILASWNTLLLTWVGLLVWLRGKQKPKSNWSWIVPVILALCAINWFSPDYFSLLLVYLHPLVALWFLDRHLRRTRPEWLTTYRRGLAILPVVLVSMVWVLTKMPGLPEDNGLFWRITQHSGAELFPGVSSHLLVSVHLFLELLHYAVWIVALPLLARPNTTNERRRLWDMNTIPLVQHPRGFPKTMTLLLCVGLLLVLVLWAGFSIDYATTRDIYFTIAMAHVMAEAPFLLRMI